MTTILESLVATNKKTLFVIYNTISFEERGVTENEHVAKKAVSKTMDYSTYPPYTYAADKNMDYIDDWDDANCDI